MNSMHNMIAIGIVFMMIGILIVVVYIRNKPKHKVTNCTFCSPQLQTTSGSVELYRASQARLSSSFSSDRTSKIPRLIWMYWHDANDVPFFVRACINTFRRHNPDHQFHFITNADLPSYLPDFSAETFRHARGSHPHTSDRIRLALLMRYGGIWVDASSFVTRSFQWVHDIQVGYNADIIIYHMNKWNTPPYPPVIENWFIAARPGASFLYAWDAELRRADTFTTVHDYLQSIQRPPLNIKLQKLGMNEYLFMHLAAQVILQSYSDGLGQYKIQSLPAEKGPFLYMDKSGWDSETTVPCLINKCSCDTLSPYIKLPRSEREKVIRSNMFDPQTVCHQFK